MSAYNCEKTQNVEKMYLRVVVEKRESFSIMKDGCEVWRFTRDSEGYNLFHYGTWILTIRHDGTVKNGHGWSRTDARNINGMLRMFGVNNIRAHIKNYQFLMD